VKITADTNVLVRAAVGDDALQSAIAIETLRKATLITRLKIVSRFIRAQR